MIELLLVVVQCMFIRCLDCVCVRLSRSFVLLVMSDDAVFESR